MSRVILLVPNFSSGKCRPIDDLLEERGYDAAANQFREHAELLMRMREIKEIALFNELNIKFVVQFAEGVFFCEARFDESPVCVCGCSFSAEEMQDEQMKFNPENILHHMLARRFFSSSIVAYTMENISISPEPKSR